MGNLGIEPSILRQIPAFQALEEQDRQVLAKRAQRFSYHKETVIFEQDDPCDSLWIILAGAVRLLTTAEKDGHEIIVATLETGDYFGNESLLPAAQRCRNANAVATPNTTLARITSYDYLAVTQQQTRIIREIKRLGSNQICDQLMQRLEQFRALHLDAASGAWLEEHELADGEEVFAEGAPADRFYMVLSGIIRLVKHIDEEDKLVARLGPGNFFGEQALIRNEPRDTSAIAEGTTRVTCLSAERFLEFYGGSLEMRAQLQRLSGFCELAGQGVVTLHSGRFLDMDSITAMYHFGDGLQVTATKVVGKPIFNMRRQRDLQSPVQSWEFEDPEEGIYRQITLQGGRLVTLTAVGHWADLGRVAEGISQRRYIWPWQLALFQQQGELWLEREQESFADTAIVCRCTGVTRGELNAAVIDGCDSVETLAARTGASRVCGSCTPLLAEIVGRSDMDAAELIGIIPVTPSVKSFHFLPRRAPVLASLPGQHIRIEGLIDGRWVQRSYTLTSPAGQRKAYEITVKRETHGLFSRWLHDRITTACAVRTSQPLGTFYLPVETNKPVVFFAGGIGITPALAMVRSLKQLERVPALYVDYSAPTSDQFAYAHELTKAAAHDDRLHVNLRATDQQGLLSQVDVDRLVQRYPDATFYVCGPAAYERAVHRCLRAGGISEERISIEHFTPPGGSKSAIASLKAANTLLSGSGLMLLLVVLFATFGPIGYQTSVQASPNFEFLWTQNTWKQLSGYSAAAIMLAGMGLSLRKRWRRIKWGHFAWWRLYHAGAALLAIGLLFAHTGFNLGQAFNHWFLLAVLATMLSGALAGIFTVLENRRPHVFCHRAKTWINRLHLIIAWPLPALIAIHLLSAYYF